MADKKQTRNLSLSKVKKTSKSLEETVKYELEEGLYKGSVITYQPIFDNVNIENLLVEFGQLMNEADDLEIELSETVQIYVIQLLIVKYFTHFKKEFSSQLLGNDETVGLLDILDHFRKTCLLDDIFNNIFSQEEVKKVFDKLTDFSARGLLQFDLDEQVKEKYSKLKIQNKELFKQIENINTGE